MNVSLEGKKLLDPAPDSYILSAGVLRITKDFRWFSGSFSDENIKYEKTEFLIESMSVELLYRFSTSRLLLQHNN
jgi:hypothetical protein